MKARLLTEENNNDKRLTQKLMAVISKYHSMANRDPAILRLLIPAQEVWRFFVDGDKQENGNWIEFERREPNYLKAMMCAFQDIFDFSAKLNVAFFEKLHLKATTGVRNTNYDSDSLDNEQPGALRVDLETCGSTLTRANTSVDGILEVLQCDRAYLGFSVWFPNKKHFHSTIFDDFVINTQCLKQVRKLVANIDKNNSKIDVAHISKWLSDFCDAQLLMHFSSFDEDIKNEFSSLIINLGRTTSDEEAADWLYQHIADSNKLDYVITSCHKKNTQEKIVNEIKRLLKLYEKHIDSSHDILNKLILIVFFAHANDQLHGFADGVTRTFVMLSLNHLLMRNGFPPAIFENPNQFDCLSLMELVEKTIDGMERVFELIETNQLYNVKTQDILQQYTMKLRQFSLFQEPDYVNYFMQAANIEHDGRQRTCRRKTLAR